MKTNASSHRAVRSRWAGWALPAVLLGTSAWGQPAAVDPSRLTLAVNDHRPLAALASELEKRFQIAITYEEGAWVAANDVEDITQDLIRSRGPGKAAPAVPVIVPRKAAVSVEYALDPAKGRPTDYSDLLSAMLLQYDAAGAPGQFRFEGRDRLYHLIPARVEGTEGRWAEVSPVLSTLVRLADAERTVDETLDEVVAQLNESSPVKVVWGYVPLNLFRQTRIRLSANGVPARDVMRQVLELLPLRATWRLYYDPTTKLYYLSFLLLPGGR